MRRILSAWLLAVSAIGLTLTATPVASAISGQTFNVQLDAPAPGDEPWDFLRLFPSSLSVHRGDVVHFAWAGNEAPHTATVVPDSDANAWRSAHQGPGGDYELIIADYAVGGDDGDLIFGPSTVNPSDPACGAPGTPCTFDGTGVVNSGLLFSSPGAQPTLDVTMNAPVGVYSFLCLLHPGMQIPVKVVRDTNPVRTPAQVDAAAAAQVAKAIAVDAEAADAQAQSVSSVVRADGSTKYTMWAGGFSNQVTANEFNDDGLEVEVGDAIRFLGNFEIHTVTFPASSIGTVPFVYTVCEVPGADPPAVSPFDCADPSAFHLVANPAALFPTPPPHKLADPDTFVNSGLIVIGQGFSFHARQPGTYRFICLVHGPAMSSTITVT